MDALGPQLDRPHHLGCARQAAHVIIAVRFKLERSPMSANHLHIHVLGKTSGIRSFAWLLQEGGSDRGWSLDVTRTSFTASAEN